MSETNLIPTLPANAPFSPEQRAWLNGFFAGCFYDRLGADAASPTPAAATKHSLLIGFGSQTGSAQGLAKKVAKEAEARDFAPVVRELNSITPADLAKEARCVIITSTWGDGDPPDNAVNFWAQLAADNAPRLESLSFAVLGLGDTNYADFCGASKKFDERLEQLGAKRLVPRGACDVDYEGTAKAWVKGLWPALSPGSIVISESETAIDPKASRIIAYSRSNPFLARLKANRRLNRDGSQKDTRHFEISLDGSGLSYEVGDALGVFPRNHPALVEELLAKLGFNGDELATSPDGTLSPVHDLLTTALVVNAPAPSFVQDAATRSRNIELLTLLDPVRKADFDQWLWGRDVLDVVMACPGAKFTPAEFVAHLRKLQPRLYSISSSPKAHPGEVHLTIAAVRYEAHGRSRQGVCSCWLADRVGQDKSDVPVFVQASPSFRLPSDLTMPVIMIGPGTGIAPFRAFLEERRATGASGRNWLFFGDQQRATDFLYEEELTALAKDGFLTRLHLAFSRDQPEKIYVQTRMLEHAAELWSWLEAGAHLYVCGDAKRMAKDVDSALHSIIETAGGRSKEQAVEYVAALKSAKRYQRDVY